MPSPSALARRAAPVVAFLAVLVLVALLAPGLGGVRRHLGDAVPGWLILAAVLELASSVSYVAMIRPVFWPDGPRRTLVEIGLSEVGMGSIVPASGAGGLALGAWVLHREGMPAERIAHRSVAFFLLKSSVNFAAVAIVGLVMFAGVGGGTTAPALTLLPAALAVLVIVAVAAVPRIGPGPDPAPDSSRARHAISSARRALITGSGEAVAIIRSGNVAVIAGAIGYWAFDNAVLWATFEALGHAPPITVILLGYLIGQLGGLLPLPGGLGGIDGGLLGTLVVYGAPAASAAAAVLLYRLILFWVPLLVGIPAFLALWRELPAEEVQKVPA